MEVDPDPDPNPCVLWPRYAELLELYPIPTKMASSGELGLGLGLGLGSGLGLGLRAWDSC